MCRGAARPRARREPRVSSSTNDRAPRAADRKTGAARAVDRRRPGRRPVPRHPRRRRARIRLPGCRSAVSNAGKTAAALMVSTVPAWIPPTRGPARRVVTSPAQSLPDDVAHGPVGIRRRPRAGPSAGRSRSRAGRTRPTGEQMPERARGPKRVGHPEGEAGGKRAQSSPGPHVGPARPGRHQVGVEAELGAQGQRLGAPGHEGVGTEIDVASAERSPSAASRRTGRRPRRRSPACPRPAASDSSHAAARPAMPPPTTATVGRGRVHVSRATRRGRRRRGRRRRGPRRSADRR